MRELAHRTSRELRVCAALLGAFALADACTPKSATVDEPWWVAAPGIADVGESCVDVGTTRACWTKGVLPALPTRVTRTTPTTPDEWRCAGERSSRTCQRRRGETPPFACVVSECAQEHPAAPDDGEWECFERGGAVVCRGGEKASGVVAGRRDEAWTCGDLRGAPGKRVCVDFAPELPSSPEFAACRYDQTPLRGRRVCARRPEPRVGTTCAASAECPRGAVCVSSACLPAAVPQPSCWLDTDCDAGQACLFATCVTRT